MSRFVWAKLPQVPAKVLWPVKVIETSTSSVLVYCHCDNAWFTLKNDETEREEVTCQNVEKWKATATRCMKRRPQTLEMFLEDIQWALSEGDGGDLVMDRPASKVTEEGVQKIDDEASRQRDEDWRDDDEVSRQIDKDIEGSVVVSRQNDEDVEDSGDVSRQSDEDLEGSGDVSRQSNEDVEGSDDISRQIDEDIEGSGDVSRQSDEDVEGSGDISRQIDEDVEGSGDISRQIDEDVEDSGEVSRQIDEDIEGSGDVSRQSDEDCQDNDDVSSDEDVEGSGDISRQIDEDVEGSDDISRQIDEDIEGSGDVSRRSDEDVEGSGDISRQSDEDLEGSGDVSRQSDEDIEDSGEVSRQRDEDWQVNDGVGRQSDEDWQDNDDVSSDEDVEGSGDISRQIDEDRRDDDEVSRQIDEDIEDSGEVSRQRDEDWQVNDGVGRQSDEDWQDNDEVSKESDTDWQVSDEGPDKKRLKVVLISTDEENTGPKRKKAKSCIKSDEDIVVESVDSDDSQISTIFPQLIFNVPVKLSAMEYEPEEGENKSSSENDDEADNSAIARDVNNSHIYVSLVQKSDLTKTGKRKKNRRVYNSKHPCPFCPKIVSNFSHHITTTKHRQEESVKEILETTDTKSKQMKIALLRLKGAHEHNMHTLKKKKGEIFLRRRSNIEDVDSEDSEDEGKIGNSIDIEKYGPCPKCLGWIRLHSIKRHTKMCILSSDSCLSTASKGTLTVQSKMMSGRLPEEASQALVKEVFPIMINDEVCKVSKGDHLIVSLGNQWMLRNKGNVIMRKYYTSSAMRLAAKFKLALQHLDNSKKELDEYFQPKHFGVVVKGALRCCFPADADEKDLKSPSNAIKLGHDIKRLVSVKLAKALINGDAEKRKEAEEFLKLMEIEWGLHVTKLARIILNERAFNRDKTLPIPEDVRKLAEYMQHEILHLDLKNCTLENYRKVAILVLARVTLFKRRRCHEVQAMRISSYEKRTSGEDELSSELRGELTAFEKNLLNRQDMVVIRGKTGKGVPVILPHGTRQALQFLTDPENRKKVGVPSGNPYVFGSNGAGVYRAYDAIGTVASDSDLQYPNLIRTSNLRKYMATMLQALNTTEAERQWVLDHLGHTMNVHKIHYRMTSDVLERVDVAKILLIQDMGLVKNFVGKKLDDIQLDDLMLENEAPSESETGAKDMDASNILTSDSVDILDEYVPEVEEDDDDDDDDDEEDNEFKRKPKTKNHVKRQKWSSEEEHEIITLFSSDFTRDKCPSQKRVEIIMRTSKANGGLIHKRSRDNIKKKVSNMMVKRRKSVDS